MGSQQIIPIAFRFMRLPVRWRVISGEHLQERRARTSKAQAEKRGQKLTSSQMTAILDPIAVKSRVLYGQLTTTSADGVKDLRELDGWYCRDEFFELPHGDVE